MERDGWPQRHLLPAARWHGQATKLRAVRAGGMANAPKRVFTILERALPRPVLAGVAIGCTMLSDDSQQRAATLDATDALARFRAHFFLPPAGQIYLDGNSLGLLSRQAESAVLRTL